MHRQNNDFGTLKEASYLKKKKDEIEAKLENGYLTISAAKGEYGGGIKLSNSENTGGAKVKIFFMSSQETS